MLRFLRIRNLAVIESVEVEFDAGFNVLTGETGAGKSILVEAVGLLLGGRASADLVRTGESQASIEAVFEEPDRELVVRREITSQGRSRSFIDGALATATALRDLSQRLVELHGQHEHQSLLDPSGHLGILDGWLGADAKVSDVASRWAALRALREQLDRSRMDAREKTARLELIDFQLTELQNADIKPAEDEELSVTRQVLASAERIERLCSESYGLLYESDGAVLPSLGGIWKRVAELATIDSTFAPHLDAREGIKAQLEDLAFFLRRYSDSVDASPARLAQVEDRLALLERIKRKYGPSLEEVVAKREQLANERQLLTADGEQTGDLLVAAAQAEAEFLGAARQLSAQRREGAARFARDVERGLGELAMSSTRFDVRFNDRELPSDSWSERGIDNAEFFVSPNPGEDLRPLVRIVSGGELSRIMLALKTLMTGQRPSHAVNRPLKTLIFDEVDAGIGGRVAEVVGGQLRGLGQGFQVLCITHLAQIAAQARTHFQIDKAVRSGRTVTSVARLSATERVDEIARMMAGASITEQVRASARELLTAVDLRQNRPRAGEAKDKQKAKGESESRGSRQA